MSGPVSKFLTKYIIVPGFSFMTMLAIFTTFHDAKLVIIYCNVK